MFLFPEAIPYVQGIIKYLEIYLNLVIILGVHWMQKILCPKALTLLRQSPSPFFPQVTYAWILA